MTDDNVKHVRTMRRLSLELEHVLERLPAGKPFDMGAAVQEAAEGVFGKGPLDEDAQQAFVMFLAGHEATRAQMIAERAEMQ